MNSKKQDTKSTHKNQLHFYTQIINNWKRNISIYKSIKKDKILRINQENKLTQWKLQNITEEIKEDK